MAAGRAARASILVVEDDPAVACTLTDVLEFAQYRVWQAVSGGDARRHMENVRDGPGSPPDLILLDLMLPDIDGLVLCSQLKSVSDVPVIICTASGRRSDPILGLKLGADDFVRKPFDVEDLVARIEAVLRRARPKAAPVPAPPASPVVRVGELVIEPARRMARLGSQSLPLTPTELRLLTVLAQSDEVRSRSYLAQEVWGYADASNSRTIDVHVRRLRVKLASASVRGPVIIAVRGMGYRLAADETANTAA
jgi:two-component system response regulator MtrA